MFVVDCRDVTILGMGGFDDIKTLVVDVNSCDTKEFNSKELRLFLRSYVDDVCNCTILNARPVQYMCNIIIEPIVLRHNNIMMLYDVNKLIIFYSKDTYNEYTCMGSERFGIPHLENGRLIVRRWESRTSSYFKDIELKECNSKFSYGCRKRFMRGALL